MKTLLQRQVAAKPTYTSASTLRTTLESGPPRARMARSTSGRGAQPRPSTTRLAKSAAVLLAALAGCRPPAPPPAPPLAPAIEQSEVDLERGFITVELSIPREPPGRKPVVIRPGSERAALLAAGAIVAGYRVNWHLLAPPSAAPAPPPENTVGKWLLASPTPKTIGRGYLSLVTADARDTVPRIIDYLMTVPEVDPSRIGIGGSSTAGMVALQALTRDRRLTAAAVTAACGDYHRFLHYSNLAMEGRPLDLDPAYAAWLREREPIRHAGAIVHAALLMVNGRQDAAVPLECVWPTVRTFRRAYARARAGERFRAIVLDGEHNLGDDATRTVMAWWTRWLALPAIARE
jgi:hypothetical protein